MKELENALEDGRADIAVHSLKDVPMDLPAGFELAAILEREPALFTAMSELNEAFPNHLGLYCSVTEPGTVSVGDPVSLLG